jgi:adenosylhomocysteine nucleosidase
MMMIGIITAVKSEADAVLSMMNVEKKESIHQVHFYEGSIHEKKVILALCGFGKINAAKCTELLILKYSLDEKSKIINLGSAGALNPILEIGDILISKRCIQFDMDITVLQNSEGKPFLKGQFQEGRDPYIYADEFLVKVCKKVSEEILQEEGLNFKIMVGTVSTGDHFINDPAWKYQTHLELEADCDEMEGAAVAQVCADANIPFVVIRSISDKPKKTEIVDYEKFKVLAAQRCAKFLAKLTTYL